MLETAAEANAKMPKDQERGGEQQTGQDEVLGRQAGNPGRVPRSFIPSAASLGKSMARAPKRPASDRLYIPLIPVSWQITCFF